MGRNEDITQSSSLLKRGGVHHQPGGRLINSYGTRFPGRQEWSCRNIHQKKVKSPGIVEQKLPSRHQGKRTVWLMRHLPESGKS